MLAFQIRYSCTVTFDKGVRLYLKYSGFFKIYCGFFNNFNKNLNNFYEVPPVHDFL